MAHAHKVRMGLRFRVVATMPSGTGSARERRDHHLVNSGVQLLDGPGQLVSEGRLAGHFLLHCGNPLDNR